MTWRRFSACGLLVALCGLGGCAALGKAEPVAPPPQAEAGTASVAASPEKQGLRVQIEAPDELKALLRNLQHMTIVADEQINKAVQSCKRARSQRLETMSSVLSRRIGTAQDNEEEEQDAPGHGQDEEPEFIESPLSQHVTRNGVTVRVDIYGDSDNRWILEIVDAENTSHVWDEHFETDQQALDEALRALDEEPLEFLGRNAQQPLN